MSTHAELLAIYSAPAPFLVTSFAANRTRNNHVFVIEVAGVPEIRGYHRRRAFIGHTDTTIGNHSSRTGDWDALAKANQLRWRPLQGTGNPGQFIIDGQPPCDEVEAQSLEMPPPETPIM
jgi:hypothetical protein